MKFDMAVNRHPDPDQFVRRSLQISHNRDGLPELLAGTICVLASASSCVPSVLHGSVGKAMSFLILCGWMGLTLRARKIVEWSRTRYLLDRVGYVQMRPRTRQQRMATALGAVEIFSGGVVLFRLMRGPVGGRVE